MIGPQTSQRTDATVGTCQLKDLIADKRFVCLCAPAGVEQSTANPSAGSGGSRGTHTAMPPFGLAWDMLPQTAKNFDGVVDTGQFIVHAG